MITLIKSRYLKNGKVHVEQVDNIYIENSWIGLSFDICEAWYQVAVEWGLYDVLARLDRVGYKPSPMHPFEFESETAQEIYTYLDNAIQQHQANTIVVGDTVTCVFPAGFDRVPTTFKGIVRKVYNTHMPHCNYVVVSSGDGSKMYANHKTHNVTKVQENRQ